MTIKKFGRITPIQGAMLCVVGYRLSRRETTLSIPDNERISIIISGRKILQRMTNVDREYDLLAWHHFLIEHEEYGYTHPFAFKGVQKAVLEAKSDKKRVILLSKIHEIEKSSLKIPNYGPTTPAQMAMLKLIGYRLSETEATITTTDDERIGNMTVGHQLLCTMTGVDLGFDLSRWHKYLIDHEEYNYTYPYGFDRLEQAVKHHKSDEDRAVLVARIPFQS